MNHTWGRCRRSGWGRRPARAARAGGGCRRNRPADPSFGQDQGFTERVDRDSRQSGWPGLPGRSCGASFGSILRCPLGGRTRAHTVVVCPLAWQARTHAVLACQWLRRGSRHYDSVSIGTCRSRDVLAGPRLGCRRGDLGLGPRTHSLLTLLAAFLQGSELLLLGSSQRGFALCWGTRQDGSHDGVRVSKK